MKLFYLFLFLVLGNTIYANQIVFKPSPDEVLVNVGDTTKKRIVEKKPVEEVILGSPDLSNNIVDDGGEDSLEIFLESEISPEFVGGEIEWNNFLNKNLRYPQLAKENGIEGRVVARFVVEKDGSITKVDLLKKVGWGCDEEVIRLLKLMPNWKPGKMNGKNVRTYFTLPIVFKLK